MKILIATGIYPPDIGGPATYSKLIAEQLPQLGFDVEVLSFGDVRKFPKVVRHAVYLFRLLKKARHAQVIYAQDPVSVGLPAMLAAKILRKRFLLKVVGDYAWEQGVQRFGVEDRLDMFSLRYQHYPLSVRVLKRIEFLVARSAERVIVPSEYLRGIVENWGIPEQQVTVIYNAFDVQVVGEHKETVRKRLGLEGKIVISVGRLVPWKGFRALIESFSEVVRSVPSARLLIAGDGPMRKELEQLIREYVLEEKVVLLGSVPHDLLLEHLKAADLFVLNTDYEGFSHQLLEVMASGTPLITTPVGGNIELVRDGENGIFVEHNDRIKLATAITRVLTDPLLSARLAEEAKRDLGRFTKDTLFSRLQPILEGAGGNTERS